MEGSMKGYKQAQETVRRPGNTSCRKAAHEIDENMLYWKRGAGSRDGLLHMRVCRT